jgi:hypothetical protein
MHANKKKGTLTYLVILSLADFGFFFSIASSHDLYLHFFLLIKYFLFSIFHD